MFIIALLSPGHIGYVGWLCVGISGIATGAFVCEPRSLKGLPTITIHRQIRE